MALELNEDQRLQKREWAMKRIAWPLLGGFVLLAALGMFGDGPISTAAAGSRNQGATVEYDRFVRAGAPARLVVSVFSKNEETGSIAINRRYFDRIRIGRITPEPSNVLVYADSVLLRFTPLDFTTVGTVIIEFEPKSFGLMEARFRRGDGSEIVFSQFAYF